MSTGLRSARVDTRLGRLFVASTDRGICFLGLDPEAAEARFQAWVKRAFPGWQATLPSASSPSDGSASQRRHLESAASQLTEFALGRRTTFDVPLDLVGTEFQLEVWQALRRIPFGTTATYGAIAGAIGRPRATRAVGMANHRNPVPILVPCHRVVAAKGLGGFGGGVEWKRRLLALEGLETGTLWCC